MDRPESDVLPVGHVEEDLVAPHDRRRTAAPRQGQFPGDVLRRTPLERQILFVADAVVLGATPVRPVACRTGRRGDGGQEDNDQQGAYGHGWKYNSQPMRRRSWAL